jgi:threonine synthase
MQSYYTGFKCTLCESEFPLDDHVKESQWLTCPKCGEKGILDIQYDYKAIAKVFTKEVLQGRKDKTIWRFLELLPVRKSPEVALLSVGNTPLYKSKHLADELGIKDLYIKDDGLNPTGSLKDRASIIAVAKALEEGIETICCSSTGNAASSLAGNAAKAGLKTVIFVPERAPHGKLSQLLIYGSNLFIVEGDYKKAFDMSKAAIDSFGFYNRNAAINPYLVEGKKTVALEICEQLDYKMPDWVVTSVGDGCTIAGVYKGFVDMMNIGFIDKIPKLLGVQASGCHPFETAFRTKKPLEESDENTLADSIAVGIPRNPLKGLRAVENSNGAYIYVEDDAILSAMRLLGKTEGVFSEPAAAASLAGLVKAVETKMIKSDESVVVISTGNGLKDVISGLKAVELPKAIKADPTQLKGILNEMSFWDQD